MTPAQDQVLRAIASDHRRGMGLSRVLCRLVIDGGQLGELVPVLAPDGETVVKKVPPAHWFERLAKGLDVGAFDKPINAEKAKRIADRILAGPSEQT